MTKRPSRSRNWPMTITAAFVIIVGCALFVVALLAAPSLGWWSAVIAIGSVVSAGLAVMAIVTNEPAWLLLDLILPN